MGFRSFPRAVVASPANNASAKNPVAAQSRASFSRLGITQDVSGCTVFAGFGVAGLTVDL